MDAIALFALRFGVASPSETNERGNNIARGSVLYASIWMDAYDFYDLVPSNYRLVEAWGDSMYRLVWCMTPFRREILTYCRRGCDSRYLSFRPPVYPRGPIGG
jgi:hypothetical protein